MPAIGDVNNPGGENGTADTSGSETPYGEIKRLTQLTADAPVAGQTRAGSALASPKRAQRAATRPQQSAPPPPTPTLPPEPAPQTAADVWQQIAASPGAADYPILQQMADQARGKPV